MAINTMTAAAAVEKVRDKFPRAVIETVEFRGEQTIVLATGQLVAVCAYLQKNLQYTFLFDHHRGRLG